MNEIHQQESYQGYNINIYRSEDHESPRDWDNLGTMYTMHTRYQPEKDFYDHFEWDQVLDEHRDLLDSFEKKYIALKFYLYDHSGITVSTSPFSCPWDSGLFGIIAVDIERIKKEYNWKKITAKRRTLIESYLKSEVKVYDTYCTGQVYQYEIIPEDNDDAESLDSCGGFYGDDGIKEIITDSKASIDYELDEIKAKKRQQVLEDIKKYGKQLFLPFPNFYSPIPV